MSLNEPYEHYSSTMRDGVNVDAYGVPLDLFGESVPEEFFAILGRLVATNGQIEYLYDRLNHLPEHERVGIRKVEQFFGRFVAGRDERNAVIHSRWVFGAHEDPEVIVGIRYKINKKSSGLVAVLSIADVEDSEREHVLVEHTVESLRRLLRRDLITANIGAQALVETMLNGASREST
ncbi:hypothetical protein [Microbacterium sp. GXF0217]